METQDGVAKIGPKLVPALIAAHKVGKFTISDLMNAVFDGDVQITESRAKTLLKAAGKRGGFARVHAEEYPSLAEFALGIAEDFAIGEAPPEVQELVLAIEEAREAWLTVAKDRNIAATRFGQLLRDHNISGSEAKFKSVIGTFYILRRTKSSTWSVSAVEIEYKKKINICEWKNVHYVGGAPHHIHGLGTEFDNHFYFFGFLDETTTLHAMALHPTYGKLCGLILSKDGNNSTASRALLVPAKIEVDGSTRFKTLDECEKELESLYAIEPDVGEGAADAKSVERIGNFVTSLKVDTNALSNVCTFDRVLKLYDH